MSRRWIGWVVALVIVAGVGAGVVVYARSRKPSGPSFETTPVERGKVVARVTATGTVSALVTVQVGSQVSGSIKELGADFNSQVKKGQVIARIDPKMFQAAVEQARANFLAAQANHLKAKVQAAEANRQLERTRALAERKLIAQADLDTSQAGADAAAAQVTAAASAIEQARAALHQTEINLAYTTIVSPINGTVISRNVDVGQTVAASLSAPTLFTIAENLEKMQVDTNVAEADVGKLKAGMTAMFKVDAYPAERFRGQVRQIRNAPQTLQNVVTYDAVIDVDNAKLQLKPGMTANVTFTYAEKDGVLRVPNAALRFRPPAEIAGPAQPRGGRGGASSAGRDGGAGLAGGQSRGDGGVTSASVDPPPVMRGGGGERGGGGGRRGGSAGGGPDGDQRTVWVLHLNEPKQVQLKVGVTDGTFTEVVSGDLKEGDQVITEMIGGTEKKDAPTRPMGRMF